MKRLLLLLSLSPCLIISACRSPQDTARLGSLADLGISYAARHGVLSTADVEALRAANAIILPPVKVEPSGK